jgi:hypothetical protein
VNLGIVATAKPAPIFEFEDLDGLPCGCVTAAFRSTQWGVTMVSVEAKGPHCTLPDHFIGQVVEMGDLLGSPDDDGDEAGSSF